MGAKVMVRCGSCGTLNRVPEERIGVDANCGQCSAPLTGSRPVGTPVDVTDGNFHEVVLGSPVPVLLEFWSPGCGHCVRMNPTLDEIASEYRGRLLVAKVDVSENRRIPSDFGIMGTPAFYVFKGGKAATSFVGAMPKDEIQKRIDGLL